MHPRIQIRNKFLELLLNNTDCADRVYKNRARPFINVEGWVSELPALVVYTRDEQASAYSEAPLAFERRAQIVVEIHAKQGEDTDDLLDHIAEQVEVLISRFTWESISMRFRLNSTQMALSDVNSSEIVGACAIQFEIVYYSNLPDDAKADSLDDFITAQNTYRVGTADNEQTVTLP